MAAIEVILKPFIDEKSIKSLNDAFKQSGINKELQQKAKEAKEKGFNGFRIK